MKKKKPIFGFCAGLLAVLLLFSATVKPSFVSQQQKKAVEEASKKSKSGQQETPTVQAQSPDAVVTPALSFDFTQEFYLLAPPIFSEILGNVKLPKQFDAFYYFFSFFRNVFGHHIATNAP